MERGGALPPRSVRETKGEKEQRIKQIETRVDERIGQFKAIAAVNKIDGTAEDATGLGGTGENREVRMGILDTNSKL